LIRLQHTLLPALVALGSLSLIGGGCTEIVDLTPTSMEDVDLVRPPGGTKFSIGGATAGAEYVVPSGTEGVWNALLKWPTHNGADISTIRVAANPGASMVELLTSATYVNDSTWVGYDEPDYAVWSPILTMGSDSMTWVLPDSVGLRLLHHAQFWVRAHYLNLPSAPVQGDRAKVVVTFAPVTDGILEYVQSRMIIEESGFSIPPNASQTVEKTVTLTDGTSLIGIAGEYHRIGQSMQVDVRDNASAPWTIVYATTARIPQFVSLSPAVQVPAGGQIRVTATYQNDTSTPVTPGPRWQDQEECRVVAYYYGQPLPVGSKTLSYR
jgi:hypothetical protein